MNCRHCRNIMFDYFEAELSSNEREAIELHLQNCEYCRRQFTLTKMENLVLRDNDDIPELNPAFNARVMGMIRSELVYQPKAAAAKKTGFRWLPTYSKTAVAAILLLACFSVPAILPGLSGHETSQQTSLPENSGSLTAEMKTSLNSSSKTKEGNDEKYWDEFNEGVKNDAMAVNNGAMTIKRGTSTNNNKPTPAELLPPVSDIAGLSDMIAAAEYKTVTPFYGQAEPEGSSRALRFNSRMDASPAVLPSLCCVPDGYILQATRYVDENQVQYSYAAADNKKTFSANLTLIAATANFAAGAGLPANEDPNSLGLKEPKTIALENLAPFQNQTRRTIEHNGLEYQLLITSTMNIEELEQLADEISLNNPEVE